MRDRVDPGTHAAELARGGSGLTVRAAREGDLAALAAMMRDQAEYQASLASAFRLARNADWLAHARSRVGKLGSTVLVAESATRLVGYLEFRTPPPAAKLSLRSRLRFWRTPPIAAAFESTRQAFFEDLWIEPEARRTGVASLLMERALAFCKARGIRHASAAVTVGNAATLAMLDKLGFEQARIVFRKAIEP